MTSAPKSNYKIGTLQTLQHCIEISNAQKLTTEEAKANVERAAMMIVKSGKTCFRQGDLFTTYTVLSSASAFDFNTVHKDLILPPAVDKYPVVVEIVAKEDVEDKVFVRVKADLNHYDGVTAMNVGFQVAEYAEYGDCNKINTLSIAGANGDAGKGTRILNFLFFLLRLLYYFLVSLLKGDSNSEFTSGWRRSTTEEKYKELSKTSKEGSWRDCRRYHVPANVSFREVLTKIDAIKNALKLSYYAVTVNFSPTVAVAFVKDIKTLKDKKAKLKCLALPPAGTGPPPPMNAYLSQTMTNCLFLNNYGRHNPTFSGQVTDIVWDWQGFYQTFNPFVFVIEVSGEIFMRVCCPPSEMKIIEDANILKGIGEPMNFCSAPFYEPGSSAAIIKATAKAKAAAAAAVAAAAAAEEEEEEEEAIDYQ